MTTMSQFCQSVQPALVSFLRSSSREDLQKLENELYIFDMMKTEIVQVHVLLPLLLKLEQLKGDEQEIRTGILNCVRFILHNTYMDKATALCTVLTIFLKQIRDFEKAEMLSGLSEEIKMATVLCISEAIQRSTSEALVEFYTMEFTGIHGQILLPLVELIEAEKYRKLRLSAIECIMVVFSVHDGADKSDIVFRRQVADTLFLYLPKVLSVLFKIATSDDKLGDLLKSTSIKALGHILCIMYEDTNEPDEKKCYNSKEFRKLIENSQSSSNEDDSPHSTILNSPKMKKEDLKKIFTRMQTKGRSTNWFRETSIRLNGIFKELSILSSHPSIKIRETYAAQFSSLLLENCSQNLKENFSILFENLIALSEDEEESIRKLSRKSLKNLQKRTKNISIFVDNADIIFDEHSKKLVQILHRQDEYELYAELLFLKGLLRNIDSKKMYSLLSLSSLKESFCMALITTVAMEPKRDLLNEEYALKQIIQCSDFTRCSKFPWRHFKFLESSRCIKTMQDICLILGKSSPANQLLFDYLLELYQTQQQHRMNEILLVMIWMLSICEDQGQTKENNFNIMSTDTIMDNILNDIHWHLALSPDATAHLKANKPSYWLTDRPYSLYDTAVEVRTQDCDSDDEHMEDTAQHVSIADVKQNILHTCIILEALGHCANNLGLTFKKHIFHCLHKVLLKVASSNTMVYEAAMFCLFSMQKALGYENISQFIEAHTDYLCYHLNMKLRRTPESSSAVDILSVVLQLTSRNSIPHLESIFQTICDECSRAQQEQHISAYLRVFHALLTSIGRWEQVCMKEVESKIDANDDPLAKSDDILSHWLEILEEKPTADFFEERRNEEPELIDNVKDDSNNAEIHDEDDRNQGIDSEENENCFPIKPEAAELPRHIEMVKVIIQQTIKFVSSSSQAHQIQSLECLIVGVPQLKDYENELLPLVHNIWQPLLEKFRQKDPIVLNRCFILLNVLSTHAKDFILKRSLDDVIPYLRNFLKNAAIQSASQISKTQTQLNKLQLKLLQEFSNLIKTMTIDGKHLNDIAEVVSLYLSEKQPKEFQKSAVDFFNDLKSFNGPLLFVIVMKKIHLKEYKLNVNRITCNKS